MPICCLQVEGLGDTEELHAAQVLGARLRLVPGLLRGHGWESQGSSRGWEQGGGESVDSWEWHFLLQILASRVMFGRYSPCTASDFTWLITRFRCTQSVQSVLMARSTQSRFEYGVCASSAKMSEVGLLGWAEIIFWNVAILGLKHYKL